MGLDRVSPPEQQFIVLTLMNQLCSIPSHQDAVLQLFLQVCPFFKLPSKSQARIDEFAFIFHSQNKSIFLSFFLDVLLCIPSSLSSSLTMAPSHSVVSSTIPLLAAATPPIQQQPTFSPGLSENAMKRVLGKRSPSYKYDELSDRKTAILEELLLPGIGELWSDNDIFVHLLVASVDGNSKVNRKGEDGLKRLSRVILEDKAVVDALFQLFLGVSSAISAQDKRSPANASVRTKVLEYLM